ncbi:MAG: hypothetical protein M3308_03380 [Actinomycetota bacterium]|nr:hypothetical protein [Actinomycetota bacterium]
MLELTITFLGDWRVGTGTGTPGALDDGVRRHDGMPVVPGGSVIGVWRDGCERVAAAMDGTNPAKPWAGWVRTLFGSQPAIDGRHAHVPVPAALAVRTATLPAAVADALTSDPKSRQRLVRCLHTIRPGVALDPDTGQATTDYLRALETTRGGLTLHSPIELDDAGWTDEQRSTAWTLLHLGAREVRTLGGDRRRGLGRCTLTVPDPTGTVAGVLAAPQPPVPVPPPGSQVGPAAPPSTRADQAAQADGWVMLELRVLCLDPVLSALVATDNTVRGQAWIPGARMLPVLVARARSAGLDVEHLLRAGGLRCEPLVPEVDGAPGRPLPRAFVAPKGTRATRLWNLLLTTAPRGVTCKSPRNCWVSEPRADGLPLRSADLRVQLHNTIEDDVQRPTEAIGGLYSYESIPSRTALRGRVWLRVSAADGDRLAAVLTGRWRLGGSKKDEYGRVEVTASATHPGPQLPSRARREITIWFATDAVLLDDRLAPVSTLDGVVAALGAALGSGVELAPREAGAVSYAVAFGRAESWQGRWVRPRPSLLSVAAGSVLVLRRVDGAEFDPAAMATLAREGLGQRRAEGFGSVIVDDPLLDVTEIDVAEIDPSDVSETAEGRIGSDSGEPDADGVRLLAELRREALRRDVEQRAATLPRAALGDELAKVAPAQLGALRVALSAAARTHDPALAGERFLASLRTAKARSERWSEEAEQQLRELLTSGAVWELLGIPAEHRTVEDEPWARTRVLAHLLAAGASAPEKGTARGTDHGA